MGERRASRPGGRRVSVVRQRVRSFSSSEADGVVVVGAGQALALDEEAERNASSGVALDHRHLTLLVGGVGVVDTFVRELAGFAGLSNRRNSEERNGSGRDDGLEHGNRSEEHTSELQSLMRTSYAVFCLQK